MKPPILSDQLKKTAASFQLNRANNGEKKMSTKKTFNKNNDEIKWKN